MAVAMKLEPITLECEHCGDDAIESATGLFRNGDGSKCASCGFPGSVYVVFEEDDCAWWRSSHDPLATCDLEDCDDCDRRTEDAAQ